MPTSKIHQAKLAVAHDLVALDELRAALGEAEDSHLPRRMRSTKELRETEEGRAVLKAKRDLENRLMQLATDADVRPALSCWMIDFEGEEAAFEKGIEAEELSETEFMRAARADYGVVPRRVAKWLERNHFVISDSGGGTDGWHLGVWCDDAEAERLCRLAHSELETEIAARAFTIALKFWNWRFTDLSTAREARAFLKAQLS